MALGPCLELSLFVNWLSYMSFTLLPKKYCIFPYISCYTYYSSLNMVNAQYLLFYGNNSIAIHCHHPERKKQLNFQRSFSSKHGVWWCGVCVLFFVAHQSSWSSATEMMTTDCLWGSAFHVPLLHFLKMIHFVKLYIEMKYKICGVESLKLINITLMSFAIIIVSWNCCYF